MIDRKYDPIPILPQNIFPALPKKTEGKMMVFTNTELDNGDMELAASCIIHVCIQEGKWELVSPERFNKIMDSHPFILSRTKPDIVQALRKLVNDGLLGLHPYIDGNYFVPSPGLAEIVLGSLKNRRMIDI